MTCDATLWRPSSRRRVGRPSSTPWGRCVTLRVCRSRRCGLTADLQKNPVDGFSAGLVDDDNILEWAIVIMG